MEGNHCFQQGDKAGFNSTVYRSQIQHQGVNVCQGSEHWKEIVNIWKGWNSLCFQSALIWVITQDTKLVSRRKVEQPCSGSQTFQKIKAGPFHVFPWHSAREFQDLDATGQNRAIGWENVRLTLHELRRWNVARPRPRLILGTYFYPDSQEVQGLPLSKVQESRSIFLGCRFLIREKCLAISMEMPQPRASIAPIPISKEFRHKNCKLDVSPLAFTLPNWSCHRKYGKNMNYSKLNSIRNTNVEDIAG